MAANDRFGEAVEIFHKACDLPVDQRAEFLEEACDGDAELRGEVESLLQHDESDHSAIRAAEAGEAVQALAATATDATIEAPPERIGRFRVIRTIGHGGMGTVYEAEQENPQRRVALKVIRAGLMSASLLKRFQHEAHVLGQLQHSGIAHIYEAGHAEIRGSRLPFFAMEYIDGLPIDSFLERRGLCERARMELLARVCDAVHYAHEKGIIHRDLKPGNILVVAEDDSDSGEAPIASLHCGTRRSCSARNQCVGRPKVLDFGVARITEADLQIVTLQTEVGQLVGTLSYMSPEQVAGDSGELDRRSDVYALGVIGHELLSGKPPHDIRGRTIPEAARIIHDEEPSRLGSINSIYRGDIETIFSKALEKDCERRYQSAAEMASDIRRFLRNEPIQARPTSTFYQLGKFARRNRALVGGIAATMLTLVAGIVVTTLLLVKSQRQEARAQRVAYAASMHSAAAALEDEDVSAAEVSLRNAPPAYRGWEWTHLASRIDLSSSTTAAPRAIYTTFYQEGRNLPSIVPVPEVSAASDALFDRQRGGWGYDDRNKMSVRSRSGQFVITIERAQARVTIRNLADGTTRSADAEELRIPLDTATGPNSLLLAVGDDGRTVAATFMGSDNRPILQVSAIDGSRHWRRKLDAHCHVQFSGNGRWLCTFLRTTWQVWDVIDGTPVGTGGNEPIYAADVSDDGRWIAAGTFAGVVAVWNVRTAEVVRSTKAHQGIVTSVRFERGSHPQLLASASEDGRILLWHTESVKPPSCLRGHVGTVYGLVFRADGQQLTSQGLDETVKTWDTTTHGDPFVLSGHEGYVYPVCVTPDGQRIVSGGWDGHFDKDGCLRMWDANSGDAIAAWGPPQEIVYAADVSGDGTHVFAAFKSRVSMYDMNTGRCLRSVEFANNATDLAVSPDLTRVAILLRSGMLYCWDYTGDSAPHLANPEARETAPMGDSAVAWSEDGRWLVHTQGAVISVRDAASLERVGELVGHEGRVQALEFSRDGTLVASASEDMSVRIWNVKDRQCIRTLKHPAGVLAVTFSPDGKRLATGCRDGLLRLYDTVSFEQVVQLAGHELYIKSLAYSPDGRRLFSGSGDRTIRVWDTEPVKVRAAARHERRSLLQELQPTVMRLFEELEDPAEVVAQLVADKTLSPRQLEIARQIVFAQAVSRSVSKEQ